MDLKLIIVVTHISILSNVQALYNNRAVDIMFGGRRWFTVVPVRRVRANVLTIQIYQLSSVTDP